jgi:thymidylate synthase (FAD)
MLPTHLQSFSDEPTRVLDDGHVMLVDVLGDEQAIINAARVSYGAGTKRMSEDKHLLRYLMRHRHTTPFEMCEIVLRVRVPMDCWRQWIRHRTASVNEYSTRYSEAIDSAQKTAPDAWRSQATNNKQGSGGLVMEWPGEFANLDSAFSGDPNGGWVGQDYYGSPGAYLSEKEAELHRLAREVYEERLKFGVAREVARKDLPLATYTEAYWKCDLHNLLHFLSLRLDPHAQKEIRDYANAIAEIVKVWVPNVWEAFEDYRLKSMTFSKMEVAGLQTILSRLTSHGFLPQKLIEVGVAGAGVTGREADELRTKFKLLLEG